MNDDDVVKRPQVRERAFFSQISLVSVYEQLLLCSKMCQAPETLGREINARHSESLPSQIKCVSAVSTCNVEYRSWTKKMSAVHQKVLRLRQVWTSTTVFFVPALLFWRHFLFTPNPIVGNLQFVRQTRATVAQLSFSSLLLCLVFRKHAESMNSPQRILARWDRSPFEPPAHLVCSRIHLRLPAGLDTPTCPFRALKLLYPSHQSKPMGVSSVTRLHRVPIRLEHRYQ